MPVLARIQKLRALPSRPDPPSSRFALKNAILKLPLLLVSHAHQLRAWQRFFAVLLRIAGVNHAKVMHVTRQILSMFSASSVHTPTPHTAHPPAPHSVCLLYYIAVARAVRRMRQHRIAHARLGAEASC
jgi:hypothetical protein